jgi:transcriptional regulator with XRE-family HTH domain
MIADRPSGLLRAADLGHGRTTPPPPAASFSLVGQDWGVTVTNFGELLRDSRLRAALTQEELAERAGISVRAVGKLESGETSRPRPATVRMLADALGLEEPELSAFIAAAYGIRRLRPVDQRSNTSRAHASRLVSSGIAAR